MTDASGDKPADESGDDPQRDDADIGWRALAGSLDDLGFVAPALPDADPETPDRNPDAGSETPGLDPDADSETPDPDSHADSETPGLDPYADSETPDPNPYADSETPGLDPHAGSETPGAHPRTDPGPYAGSETPGLDPDADSETPGRDPDAGSETPGAHPHAGSETPGAHPHAGSETPGLDPDAGSETPGAHPHAGSETPGAHPHAGSETPGAHPHAGSETPGAHPRTDPGPDAGSETPHPHPDLTRSGHPRPRQYSRAAVTSFAVLAGLLILVYAGFSIRFLHKAVIAPGTTADIEEFVQVNDHPAYATDASISLVSVRTSFGPSLFEVVGGWLDGALEVVDLEDILGERTVAENREDGRMQMDQSTQVAVAVALEHLGYDVMTPIGARIERVMSDSPAEDALRAGDIVQFVGDTPIMTAQQLSDTIKANEPGAATALTALEPDGQIRTVTVTLADRDGVALLGVLVTTHVEFAELPIDVTLNVENIGGPSAGLAFTLSVIDALTPEPLTGNLDVAATGTIHHDGTVGPIGGVPQKSHAVVRSGTDLFLVPAAQAEEAIAVAEPSVTVVGVETLEDAIAAIEAHQS